MAGRALAIITCLLAHPAAAAQDSVRAAHEGRGSVDASAIPASVRAAVATEIFRRIKPHWKPLVGPETRLLRTRVTVSLNRDGSLGGEPQVAQTGITEGNRSFAEQHRQDAVRATRLAAPFSLPQLYFEAWKTITPTLRYEE